MNKLKLNLAHEAGEVLSKEDMKRFWEEPVVEVFPTYVPVNRLSQNVLIAKVKL